MTHALSRPATAALGALTAGALTLGAAVSMPTAAATCASFFGLSTSGQCSSTFSSIAIAIGENAEAHADGILGAAITFGSFSSASTVAGAVLNLAVTLGENNLTRAGGIGSIAAVANSINQSVFAGSGPATDGNIGNVAASLGGPQAAEVSATGIGNLSLNVAGAGRIAGNGVGLATVNFVGLGVNLNNVATFNGVVNALGTNTKISNSAGQGGIGNLAFNLAGIDNVITTSGALAVAGAIGSTSQAVNQTGPGVSFSFARQNTPVAASRLAAASVASNSPTGSATPAGARTATGKARAGRG